MIIAVCAAAWLAIITRLIVLQILNYDHYRGKVIDNIQAETQVSAKRGTIYDRNMTQLATNATVWRVFISPRDIADDAQAELIANGLSSLLGVEHSMVIERAGRKGRADETIKKNVEETEADRLLEFIAENDLDEQIHLEATTKRYYPYGTLASHVIGCVGTDGGLIGLELRYDSELTGVPGRYITARNASGKRMPFKYDSYVEAENGYNLVTTLDLNIQYILENQLKKTFEDSQPQNRVTGIVMNVNTGEVLGMATYPDFDLNSPYVLDEASQTKLDSCDYLPDTAEYNNYYWDLVYSMWRNKAVSELYEPGSTFKIITTSMALEENLVRLDEMFTCTGSHFIEGYSKPIHCHKRSGHGTVTFAEGLQQSCNPILMTIAARVGRERFYDYFKAYGYTERTGVDLPGEAGSIYHALSGFNQVELAVYSFGQTFKVTPLQQLTAICAVANGGYLVTPHMVSAMVDDDGNIVKSFDSEIKRQVVSTEVCQTIAKVLEEGVSGNGGAKNAYVAGYKIAAKTGTSEVRDVLDENGESYLRVGSCVAYAPSDDPQIAAIIVVDQLQQGVNPVYGSIVAAPYISGLLDEILPNLGVERQYTEAEQKKLTVSVSSYVGWPLEDAKKAITNKGIKYEVIGNQNSDGSSVVSYQIPPAGNTLMKDTGKIILYTGGAVADENIEVPDLKGYTAKLANRILVNLGFNVRIEGTTNYDIGTGAVVTSQSPEPGTLLSYGDVVEITVRYIDGTAN